MNNGNQSCVTLCLPINSVVTTAKLLHIQIMSELEIVESVEATTGGIVHNYLWKISFTDTSPIFKTSLTQN